MLSVVGVAALTLFAACGSDRTPSSDELFVNTAPELDAELEFDGRAEEVAIAPNGDIWLGTGVGQIITGETVLSPWRHMLYPPIREDWERFRSSPSRSSTQHIAFFTPDTMIALGLGDELIRSVDGGERWDTVGFADASTPNVSFTDAVFAFPSGLGWIGGGAYYDSTSLFVTEDYGATWRSLPHPWESRISSIYMQDTASALVGGLWNHLARTDDGGSTWTLLPTPYDQGVVPEGSGERSRNLEAVALIGSRMLVRQGDRVFHSSQEEVAWSLLPGEIRMFAYDREERQVYGINARGEVLEYDEALRPTRFGDFAARGFPIHMAARDGKVVVLEREGALLEVTDTGSRYGFPLALDSSWRMRKVRRHEDRVWAVSSHQIYTSVDMGETWDRVGFMPTEIRSFLVRSDGKLLLWDGHARNVVYDLETGTLSPSSALRGYDVVDILRIAGKWVAFGGRQYETMGRVEVGRTYHAGQFEGSRDHGFVLISDDEGEHWREVDEWQGGGVANVFLDPETEDLVLVSYLGGVRRLDSSAGYAGTDLILPSEETWEEVPYVEVPSVIYFEDEDKGYIDGWIHHLGERRYSTSDGGRTWREESTERHGILSAGASNGYVILRGSEMEGGRQVVFQSGASEVPVWTPEVPEQSPTEYPWMGITDLSVDADDRILVLVDGTELIVLEVPQVDSAARGKVR